MSCERWTLELAALAAIVCAGSIVTCFDIPADCKDLAAKYAPNYQIAVNEGSTFRKVERGSLPSELVVWGGDFREWVMPAAAAASLLLVALRYGLGYEITFRMQDFDVCNANDTELPVAPAIYYTSCPNDIDYIKFRKFGKGVALVPLSEPLVARVSTAAPYSDTHRDGVLHAYDKETLSSGAFLTLSKFRSLKSKLPNCKFIEKECNASEEQSTYVVLAAPNGPWVTSRGASIGLHERICSKNLTIIRSENTSCFRSSLSFLDQENVSFLFLDKDLYMYKSNFLPVSLKKSAESDSCPTGDSNNVFQDVYKMGNGKYMNQYAPQIADVVNRFCPSLEQLKQVVDAKPTDPFDIEVAACKWASQHKNAFESWIKKKRKYELYCYTCAKDPLNEEYIKTINDVKQFIKHDDFDLSISVITIDCHSHQNIQEKFNVSHEEECRLMGAIAWSSSEGVKEIAKTANQKQIPLILVGPITSDTPIGPASNTISGRLEDLAHFYRAFCDKCGWSRLALVSDETTYAKAFASYLLKTNRFVYMERKVTSENVTDMLKSFQAEEARVFIVNTNSSMAMKILRSAIMLGMVPPQYAWIVREWSPEVEPIKTETELSWKDMTLFSLGTAWRGAGNSTNFEPKEGNALLSKRLRTLWPGAAWPSFAAPLVDAMLLLNYSFSIFERLYSRTSCEMNRIGGHALSFSEIYNQTNVQGIDRNINFRNGIVETVMVYLEQWKGANRTVLGYWSLSTDPYQEIRNDACGARVRDRPYCSFVASAETFVQKCYDIPLYSLFAVLAVLPVVFAISRRARLKRLAVRDLNLLAHILESKRITSIVHGDSLCMHSKIGTGNFGSVYLATLRQSRERAILVAAKELRHESDKDEYLQEAGILQQLDHENVVKFVGICVSNGSLLILMEYAFHGDLLQYLQARRHLAEGKLVGPNDEHEALHVSPVALTRMAREAASALQYLEQQDMVHRDVRAANCLVDEQRTLKLADFGLARKLCDNLEYTSIKRAMFPVLWMAPESLNHGKFSTATDVWALGVLCLELVTLGSRPYGERAPHQVLAYVRLGHHPPLPLDASQQTVSLVKACWKQDAAQRATAAEVVNFLSRQPCALSPALLPAPDIMDISTDLFG